MLTGKNTISRLNNSCINKSIQDDFIEKHCSNLDSSQLQIIRLGFESGLSRSKIIFYAKPEFSWQQMEQIQLGFQNGLDEFRVLYYCSTKFNWQQMEQIRKGFEENLTLEQVKSYAFYHFSSNIMKNMREKYLIMNI